MSTLQRGWCSMPWQKRKPSKKHDRKKKSQRFWKGRRARKLEIRHVPKSAKIGENGSKAVRKPKPPTKRMVYHGLPLPPSLYRFWWCWRDKGVSRGGIALEAQSSSNKAENLMTTREKNQWKLIEGGCVRARKYCRGKTKRKNYGSIGRKGPGQHSEDYPCFLSSLRRKQPSCSLTTMAAQVKALQSIDIRKPISVIPWYPPQTFSLQDEFVAAAQKGRGHFIL